MVKQLYETFQQMPVTELTDVLKRIYKAAEKCHICFKEFAHVELQGNIDFENIKLIDHCH